MDITTKFPQHDNPSTKAIQSLIQLRAVERGWLEVLQAIDRGIDAPWSRYDFYKAARNGHVHVIQWLLERFPCDNKALYEGAVHERHFAILEWLVRRGILPTDCARCCQLAAKHGDLALLQWLRRNHCPWNAKTCYAAASGGHLHVLQWARQEGCPWDETVCMYAAAGGHLDILQWAHQHGCAQNEFTCKCRARQSHLHLLESVRTTRATIE